MDDTREQSRPVSKKQYGKGELIDLLRPFEEYYPEQRVEEWEFYNNMQESIKAYNERIKADQDIILLEETLDEIKIKLSKKHREYFHLGTKDQKKGCKASLEETKGL